MVEIEVLNLLGQSVTTLVTQVHQAGYYQVVWHGTDSQGQPVESGMYFVRMTTTDQVSARKMLLVK